MFYDVESFPFAHTIQDGYKEIKEEYLALTNSDFRDWNRAASYGNRTWTVFVLHRDESLFGTKDVQARGLTPDVLREIQDQHAALCPKTLEILKGVPRFVGAVFSRLLAHSDVFPHVGAYRGMKQKILRAHLGLEVPAGCTFTSSGETREVNEGELMIFDDSFVHSATNPTDKDRGILIFDFVIGYQGFL